MSCFNCEKSAAQHCGRCKAASYCGKTCQINHWKKHKAMCISDEDTTTVINEITDLIAGNLYTVMAYYNPVEIQIQMHTDLSEVIIKRREYVNSQSSLSPTNASLNYYFATITWNVNDANSNDYTQLKYRFKNRECLLKLPAMPEKYELIRQKMKKQISEWTISFNY
jgi:hypothetical protein